MRLLTRRNGCDSYWMGHRWDFWTDIHSPRAGIWDCWPEGLLRALENNNRLCSGRPGLCYWSSGYFLWLLRELWSPLFVKVGDKFTQLGLVSWGQSLGSILQHVHWCAQLPQWIKVIMWEGQWFTPRDAHIRNSQLI